MVKIAAEHEQGGRPDAAATLYREATVMDPMNAVAVAKAAQVSAWPVQNAISHPIHRSGPGSGYKVLRLLESAERLIETGDRKEAKKKLKEARALMDEDPGLWSIGEKGPDGRLGRAEARLRAFEAAGGVTE